MRIATLSRLVPNLTPVCSRLRSGILYIRDMFLFRRLSSLLVVLLCACAAGDHEPRFTQGPGEFGRFISQKALEYGAKNVSTNDLPRIQARWKYFEDPDGVQFHLGLAQFDEVQKSLRKAFGPPAHEPTETTDHGKLAWYAASEIGVGLQFGYNKKGAFVILLRPRSGLFNRALPAGKSNDKVQER